MYSVSSRHRLFAGAPLSAIALAMPSAAQPTARARVFRHGLELRLAARDGQPDSYSESVTFRSRHSVAPKAVMDRCIMKASGAAPCQWSSPGGV